MIEIKNINNGFKVYFKKHLFFTHTIKRPMIKMGIGVGSFKEKHGLFKIKEKKKKLYNLTKFEITSKSKSKIIIKFTEMEVNLTLIGEIVNDRLELSLECPNTEINRYWIYLSAKEGEAIYGCGEQYSELNLRGKNVPLWVSEQGVGRGDPKIMTGILNLAMGAGGYWHSTYHPQPTFISILNYSLHAESTVYSEFNFKKKDSHVLYFWGNPKKIIIDKQDSTVKILSRLTEILGRQPKLPEWIHDGMWIAIQGEGGKEKVRERLQKALDAGVIISAIWSQDWQGIKKTIFGTNLFWDWKWNGGGREIRFPGFPDFVKEMNGRGIKYIGYINSFLNLEGDLYKLAHEKEYCVKNSEGEDYIIKPINFPVALVDLTNPEAYEWIKDVMKENMIEEAGLSGWMSDFGEFLPTDAVLYSDVSGEVYHNQYPVDWQKANYEALKETGNLGKIIFFTRSGYSHTSKYSTMIWAGDQLVSWSMDDGLASVIPGALSLGMCGIGYHHSDIGGFTTFKPIFKRKKELMMRWIEQSAFTILMRSHEGNQPENNIQFDSDAEILSQFAKMTQVHVHLKPYLIAISDDYQETGLPCMRLCSLHYEDDPQLQSIKYQYLFGRDLLVAPVIKPKKKTWKVYFPDDDWIHLWSEKEFKKGWNIVEAPIGKPPVFYRKDSKFVELFNSIKNI